jgi:RAD54-like protein 2
MRHEVPRPNRWIPVEVWQSKGITAHEMTLPQGKKIIQLIIFIKINFLFADVSIQTNSADKSKIFLKAGQKVVVLKSPRGICLQLESGKVIAIRASAKSGPQQFLNPTNSAPSTASNSNDVIDMTNSDDDNEEEPKKMETSTVEEKPPEKVNKILPKPNLIQRKPKEPENSTNPPKSSWNQPPPMSFYPYDQQSNGQYSKSAPTEQREYFHKIFEFLN